MEIYVVFARTAVDGKERIERCKYRAVKAFHKFIIHQNSSRSQILMNKSLDL